MPLSLRPLGAAASLTFISSAALTSVAVSRENIDTSMDMKRSLVADCGAACGLRLVYATRQSLEEIKVGRIDHLEPRRHPAERMQYER